QSRRCSRPRPRPAPALDRQAQKTASGAGTPNRQRKAAPPSKTFDKCRRSRNADAHRRRDSSSLRIDSLVHPTAHASQKQGPNELRMKTCPRADPVIHYQAVRVAARVADFCVCRLASRGLTADGPGPWHFGFFLLTNGFPEQVIAGHEVVW